MKSQIFAFSIATLILLAAPAIALEPIPGSITFGGQPATRLEKSPIGSSLSHDFYSGSTRYSETYILQPDRSLKLVNRTMQPGR